MSRFLLRAGEALFRILCPAGRYPDGCVTFGETDRIMGEPVRFGIEIEREEDGRWIAGVPALSGVMCYGETRDEAVAHVQALALRVIADRLDHAEAPPELVSVTFEAA